MRLATLRCSNLNRNFRFFQAILDPLFPTVSPAAEGGAPVVPAGGSAGGGQEWQRGFDTLWRPGDGDVVAT